MLQHKCFKGGILQLGYNLNCLCSYLEASVMSINELRAKALANLCPVSVIIGSRHEFPKSVSTIVYVQEVLVKFLNTNKRC